MLFVYSLAYFFIACEFLCLFVVVFFFKQKTAYELRISDWSSDVCSSDLEDGRRPDGALEPVEGVGHEIRPDRRPDAVSERRDASGAGRAEGMERRAVGVVDGVGDDLGRDRPERDADGEDQIGRAAWRERGCQ